MMVWCVILGGLVTLLVPVYVVFTTAGIMLLAISAGGLIFRPRVEVIGRLPEKIIAGQPVQVGYELRNRSRLPAYDISLGFFELPSTLQEVDAEGYLPELRGGARAEYPVTIQASRRGMYVVAEPRCYCSFPFNLFRVGRRTRRQSRLLVVPQDTPIGPLAMSVSQRYQPGGIALASHVGESPEYIGNREYRSGDAPRRIDARAWARLAQPAVKEYNEEYYYHVAVVLDTHVGFRFLRGPGATAAFEAAVSLTASVGESLSRGEWIIDFFAAGPDLYVFRSGRHTAHFESLLEILACVGHCRRNPFEVVTPALAGELTNTSAVVFVLLDWDRSREQLVRMALEAGCGVRVYLVREKATSLDTTEAESWAGPFMRFSAKQIREGAGEVR